MRTYTLHLPVDTRPGEAHGLDRAHLVPDGFSWPAFAFSPLWFVFHRLWLAAIGVLALLVATRFLGHILGLRPVAGLAVTLLVLVLVGLEASSLRRWSYARRGRPVRDVVVAASAEEAEFKAMTRWFDPAAAARPAGGLYPLDSGQPTEPVIGLFPASEGRR